MEKLSFFIVMLSVLTVVHSADEDLPGVKKKIDGMFNKPPSSKELSENRVFDSSTVLTRLFTKSNGMKYDSLVLGNSKTIDASHFNSSKRTAFIVHGFKSSGDGESITLVRDALLKTSDDNIITLDWSKFSSGNYIIARISAPDVGKYLAKFINFLIKSHGLNPDTTTLIGHSLGAHIMGIAGQTTSKKINHTIGLDPAGPLFVGLGKDERISDDDAKYVEIIHTNAGLLGYPDPLGHYDFYPNGGTVQESCNPLKDNGACSHNRAYKYLAEQILKKGPEFYAVKCESFGNFLIGLCSNNNVTIMGELRNVPAVKGTYYLQTNGKSPYAKGPIKRKLFG